MKKTTQQSQDNLAKARARKQELAEQRRLEEEQAEIEAEQRKVQEEQRRIEEAQEVRAKMKVLFAWNLLSSELTGLYDEMDKLAKKAPNEPVTERQLNIVNGLLRKAKLLLQGDLIIDEVEIFVSAGDNPEYRDIVTVLRQIRQGLDRYKAQHDFLFVPRFQQLVREHNLQDEIPGNYFADMKKLEDGTTE